MHNLFTARLYIVGLSFMAILFTAGCQTLEEKQRMAAHVVTSNAGPNGNVEPRGDIRVTPGEMQTVFFIPEAGYEIASVIVDGDDIGSMPAYVFANVQRDHVVSVRFERKNSSSTEKTPSRKTRKKSVRKKQAPRKKVVPEQIAVVKKTVVVEPEVVPMAAIIESKKVQAEEKSIVEVKPAKLEPVVIAEPVVTSEAEVTPEPITTLSTVDSTVSENHSAEEIKPAVKRLKKRNANNTPKRVTSFSGDANSKGLAIAVEADKRDLGWGDFLVDMIMELSNRNGDMVTRFMHYKGLEQPEDGDKTVIVFDRPADIKGTALLTHAHKGQTSDDQWLYLPAIKRVKRISSATKTGAFMGSEFSYEEFSSQEVDKFDFTWLRDEIFEGKNCHVLEARPRDPKSGYVRQIRWMDKEELRIQRIDYYDRKNSLLKTLTMDGYHRHLDKFWRAKTFDMVNHQSGRKTRLVWQNYRFGMGLTDNLFAKNSLKRNR